VTIHKSLRVKSTMTRARNVWKRVERVIKLEEDGKFAEGASVFGLVKVKTRLKVKGTKAPKKEAAAAAEGGAPGAAAAAPAAAGAKPAAGAKAPAAAAKPAAKAAK
jgi:small basic protein (TIGR04137 family)